MTKKDSRLYGNDEKGWIFNKSHMDNRVFIMNNAKCIIIRILN